jgi:SWI/SNF-related matrix-associated actin-dependent regulator 1 of chromatin subfamily A
MKLYPFQEEGVRFLNSRSYAILCDEMGLGKTLQAITAALNEDKGILVVCPPYLVGNWLNEIRKVNVNRFVKHIRKEDFYARNGKVFIWPEPNEIFVCAYTQLPLAAPGQVPKFTGELPKKPVIVIGDEAHFVKNSRSSRTKSFRALVSAAKQSSFSKIWLLTGTPILNKPPELWALVQALNYRGKKIFGSWEEFVKGFNGYQEVIPLVEQVRTVWGLPDKAISEKLKGYYLRRTKKEVLPDLPDKTIQRYYTKTKTFIDPENFDYDQSVKLGNIHPKRKTQSYEKYLAVPDLIEDYEKTETPLVVFSCYVDSIIELGGKPFWGAIHGAVPQAERTKIIDDFQNGHINYLAGTIQTLGIGHTLTRSCNAIFIDLDFTPANNLQAEDRLLRIGQKNAVNIIQVVGDDIVERRLNKILNDKAALIGEFNRIMDKDREDD